MWLVGGVLVYATALVVGGRGSVGALLKSSAYALMPLALAPIPVVGWLAAAYAAGLQVVAVLTTMHLGALRSVVAVLAPVALAIGAMLLLTLLFFSVISTGP